MANQAKSEKQKMLRGELYSAQDAELAAERLRAERLLLRYNQAEPEEREAVLRALFGSCGEGVVVRPSFQCDYGYNIHLERGVFLNFNCVLLDVMPIRIGEGTQIGPAVQIYAADHPRDRETRLRGLECGKPVTVGKNVWIGGGAVLLPGITVGDGAVIGAGTVVTKDIPAGATVVGNPGRVVG
ncbi:MAG TPA: maltose acetyltransferase domain-containing protein [Acidobacteriaceae bacterium]|nr:maltose acetyltransferase domain-containing protein [Acidobacteriaceae bacterium]